MEYKFNVTGKDRKNLVKAISGITGLESVYHYAPTFAFTIGSYTVNRSGTLLCDNEMLQADAESLIESLVEMGFSYESTDESEVTDDSADETQTESDKLVISMPLDGFTELAIENLNKMVKSKESLIKQALGTDELPIEISDDQISFAWFNEITGDEVATYSQFIAALCNTAKKKKRVNSKENPITNAKFEMRVFLVSIGLNGENFRNVRRVLAKNLDGNSAWKNK